LPNALVVSRGGRLFLVALLRLAQWRIRHPTLPLGAGKAHSALQADFRLLLQLALALFLDRLLIKQHPAVPLGIPQAAIGSNNSTPLELVQRQSTHTVIHLPHDPHFPSSQKKVFRSRIAHRSRSHDLGRGARAAGVQGCLLGAGRPRSGRRRGILWKGSVAGSSVGVKVV
jgi:hypothetical protein